MKKKLIIQIVVVAVLLGLVTFLAVYYTTNTDGYKFKKEYEDYNGKKYNNDEREYLSVKINRNNIVKYSEYADIKKLLTEGTGVIYFGFPTCPWCRNIVPVLLDAASETKLENIYYFNALSMRDIKQLNDAGEIETVKNGTDEYYELINILGRYLGDYRGLNDLTIKRLYFPTIVFVKDGAVVDIHIGTISEHTNGYEELTEEQKTSLKNTLVNKIRKVQVLTCGASGC